jgi:hypothetical protein
MNQINSGEKEQLKADIGFYTGMILLVIMWVMVIVSMLYIGVSLIAQIVWSVAGLLLGCVAIGCIVYWSKIEMER